MTKVKIPEGFARCRFFSMLYPSVGKDSDDTMQPASTTTHQTTTSLSTQKNTKDKLVSARSAIEGTGDEILRVVYVSEFVDVCALCSRSVDALSDVRELCTKALVRREVYPFVVVFGDSDANLEKYWKRRITILTQELSARTKSSVSKQRNNVREAKLERSLGLVNKHSYIIENHLCSSHYCV